MTTEKSVRIDTGEVEKEKKRVGIEEEKEKEDMEVEEEEEDPIVGKIENPTPTTQVKITTVGGGW